MSKRLRELREEYEQCLHAMQSGVKAMMELAERIGIHNPDTDPKHLRVGVNSAMSLNGALVEILLSKGVFTAEEWGEMMLEYARAEVNRYENTLSQALGRPVKLL